MIIDDAKAITRARAKLRRQLRKLAEIDADISLALEEYGFPEPRLRGVGFTMLLHTIVSQQLSVHAAEAIWQRVCQRFKTLDPPTIRRCRATTLRGLGLSGKKVEYVKALAKAFEGKNSKLYDLEACDDEVVIENITAVKGLGRWSAEIYLLFSLQRKDVFPADDLALQVALQHLKRRRVKPSAKEARALVESWAPLRSAGSLLLWHYYKHAVKGKGSTA